MQWADVTRRPPDKILRQFAAIWLVFFAGLGVWRILQQQAELGGALVAVGLVVGTLGIARPAVVRWIYTGWMVAAFPLGWTISQIMLAGLFYGMFTPVAAFFRLIKRDALQLRPRDNIESYWMAKSQGPDVQDYFRQF